ncbi:serine/threonine protein kinase [Roseimicrobium sp. ORNL1]|nr:serine/threonine protein kinase [Roseimicrobium sp. ORNL1]
MSRLLPDGEYLLESFIGQGGMGAVYRGVQMPLKRPVAVKILQRRHAGDELHFEDRFRQEAYAMATLVHPNVVQVYDCGDAGEEFLFISMELVEGGDLSQAMSHGHHLALASALQLLVPICEGLQAAHEHGLVHRDIKPANILLTPDSKPKVADFGLAKRFDAQTTFVTQGGLGMGTPDYAAPEQYEESANLDHRVDIYSLGVMFYQMLTGHLPRGIFKQASRLVRVDPRMDTVLQKAMQHDRAERYQSVAQMKVDLQHILATWMAPPRPRMVVQTGKVHVGTGMLPAATGRVQTTAGRAPTVNGSRVPTMTGRVQTVAKPVASPPTTIFRHRPCCPATCAVKKRAREAMLAGMLILVALGGAATIVATRHVSPTVSAAVEPEAPKHKKNPHAHSSGPASATRQALTSTKSGTAASAGALPPLPVRPSLQTLDLLALTDPSKDDVLPRGPAQKNGWVREGATLVYTGSGKPGKVVAPVALECLDYELEVRAERREGTASLHVDLPLSAGRILPVVLNDPSRQLLNEKQGPGWLRNATLVHALIRVVSKAGETEDDRLVVYDVAAKTEIFNWKGRLASMGTTGESQAEFAGKRLTSLFLPRDSYIIRMWKLTIFEGKAVRLRESGPSPQNNPSVAQRAPSFSASSSSSSGDSPSEAVPLTKTDARLAKLESGFQQRRESDAQKPFATAMANLNAGYVRALASARTTAEKQGNRTHLPLYDDEATRAKAGTPPPQSDAPDTPEPLAKLRSTYRTEMAKYELVRNKTDAALHDIYIGALDAYIEELARSNDARAREVKEVRQQIAAKKPVVPASPGPQDTGAGGRPLAPAR